MCRRFPREGQQAALTYNKAHAVTRISMRLQDWTRNGLLMKLFLYEHLCSGALVGQPARAALLAEGWAMLAAVLEDFGRLRGVSIHTLLDPTVLPPDWRVPLNVRLHEGRLDQEHVFRSLARAADFTLVIAPECDGLLEERCRWVEEEGGRLLGPAAGAVRRTADKLTLACHLREHGIPTPPCARSPGEWSSPLVCKPRDGAGSQATFLVHDPAELSACLNRARQESWQGEMIVQPFVPGQAASVALLLGPGKCLSLPAAAQYLSDDGRFHYQGGSLPLAPALDARARQLAEHAVRIIEGLHGYVGVDLVLGEPADGSQDVVIEINPRLTTSYVGLRALARFNLAEALLAVRTEAPLPSMSWQPGPIHFRHDGRVL
jgi:predicted ATP-grasp superfamily ATP-dependent carboligase